MRKRLTFANVCSFLALLVALGTGGAYAANTVFSTDIVDGEVKAVDLASNSVRTSKIGTGQVTSSDLAPPEPWTRVRAGSTTSDRCQNHNVGAVFCSYQASLSGPFAPWTNYGPGYPTAAFYKDQLGVVHLKGLVAPNRNTLSAAPQVNPIFRLPEGYRPTRQRVFASVGEERFSAWQVAPARVDVAVDGLVEAVQDCADADGPCSADATYLTLDGISFRPDE